MESYYKRKYQAFISSTFEDMKEHRKTAIEAILQTGNIPAGMEYFCAENNNTLNIIKNWIDESDIYILLLGKSYGSVYEETGKSYTQLEYEYAILNSKPGFSIIINEEPDKKSLGLDYIKYINFRELVKRKSGFYCGFYSNLSDIKFEVFKSLKNICSKPELQNRGWVKLIDVNNNRNLISSDSNMDLKKKEPKINWQIFIGKQKWKNTPIIMKNSIYVGSAGYAWNEGDEKDGIYCINIESGNIEWECQTKSDVNELSIFEEKVIAGCDDGTVWCVSINDSSIIWKTKFENAVTTKIHLIKSQEYGSFLVIITCEGDINIVDLNTGNIISKLSLRKIIMANSIIVNEHIYIPTVSGEIYKLHCDFMKNKFSINKIYIIEYYCDYDKSKNRAELYSTPIIDNGKIYVAYARKTYFSTPPVICIDEMSDEIIWYGNDSNKYSGSFGNIRSDIFIVNNSTFPHKYWMFFDKLILSST